MSFTHRNQLLRALELAARMSASPRMMLGAALLVRGVNVNDRRVWHLYFEANAHCMQYAHKEGAD